MRIDRFIEPPGTAASGLFARPLWALGFRPFFLVAGVFAALWLVLWLLALFVPMQPPLAAQGADWHAHEMIFGFAVAVLAGFLLTAARNWTRQPTPTNARLAGLVLLWLVGRVVMLLGARLPSALVAAIDIAFLPVLAWVLALRLWRTQSRRNYPFVALLLALAGVDLLFHLAPLLRLQTMTLAVEVMVVFLVVMGGRVIPSFTRNALPEARVTSRAWLDALAVASSVAYPIAQLAGLGLASDLLALLAGTSNLARLAGWGSLATRRAPILWVLHLGYLWIGIGYLMMGLARWLPGLAGSAPLHALTVGALGTLTLGMMARVSLGHTGRPLVLPRSMSVAFALLTVAALARVVLPLVSPDLMTAGLMVSGIAWSCAFAVFVAVYWPILTRPRSDGAPG